MPKATNKITSTTELVDAVKDAVAGAEATTGDAGTELPKSELETGSGQQAAAGETDRTVMSGDASSAAFVVPSWIGTAVPGEATGVIDTDVIQPVPVVSPPGVSLGLLDVRTTIGYIIRCHRNSGIWRAGRFWPPENLPVPSEDFTEDQLTALKNEPLLSVLPVQA